MASSSGNSTGSEEDPKVSIDLRKRKRMQSNRESARRSRVRKQKHLDDLTAQAAQLRKENSQIGASTNISTHQYLNVEAENSVLRAQMAELSQRLESLNDIIHNNYMNTNNNVLFETEDVFGTGHEGFMNNPWNLMYLNQQPIMASADLFQY